MNTQEITSKNTSINTTKIPYLFNHLDWKAMKVMWPRIIVIDYGCGRKIDHIAQFLKQFNLEYIGFDPYWGPITDQDDIEKLIAHYKEQGGTPVIVCSNVLNVIPDLDQVWETKQFIQQFDTPYFFKFYEGDKSNVGRMTKPDCWQWNAPTKYYMEGDKGEGIKKQILTQRLYIQFVK